MADFEFSFTFDEGNFENDFTGDIYDFENMWHEMSEEFRQKEESEHFQQLFEQKLQITTTSSNFCHKKEHSIEQKLQITTASNFCHKKERSI